MSIQSIINKAENITISRNKISGQTMSRGGRLRSALVASAQPWTIGVEYAPYQTLESMRGIIEDLEKLDVIGSEDVDIGSTNVNLSWLVSYQGELTPAQIGQLAVSANPIGNTIDIKTDAVTGSSPGDIVFKKGDYITFDTGYRYPYTVTADITIGAVFGGSVISVQLNRPVIEQPGYTFPNKGVLVGTDVTWRVKCMNKPTYTVIPGRYVVVSGEYVFMELIG